MNVVLNVFFFIEKNNLNILNESQFNHHTLPVTPARAPNFINNKPHT